MSSLQVASGSSSGVGSRNASLKPSGAGEQRFFLPDTYFQDERFAHDRVAGMPERWKKRLISAHYQQHQVNRFEANTALREITEKLNAVRLPLDATDGDICARADEFARAAMDIGRIHHQIENVRAGMAHYVAACQVSPPPEDIEHAPAIARMTCRDWWRRGLRKMHAKAVESAAIQLGYVNRARDLYVSNESLARRGQQLRRNALMMENTVMRNELEQEYTLAELAAAGTANKAIRRGELMTRIAGFERIALDCGHGGLFLTVTCPSRMHKWVKSGSGVYENQKFDGTTPREAQAYLCKQYSLIRSALARAGLQIYGFRIAEPHHDGCPHWHILIFHAAGKSQEITDIFRGYMLKDSPDERGADVHRVKAETIDWSRGTAAGYIAKYVAKNIDGLHVENDLYGNPAMETSARVEAWASTWGIRQFQQVGGAPVGVWRELRRIGAIPEGAPKHLRDAHTAVNKVEDENGTRKADWAAYCIAQGGVFIGRDYRVRIAVERTGEVGRYGEAIAARPVGVETVGGEFYRDGIVPDRFRLVEWLVRSVRHVWQVVKRGVQAAGFPPPRTCVNNCTREEEENGRENGGRVDPGGRKRIFEAVRDGEKSGGGGFSADSWFIEGAFC